MHNSPAVRLHHEASSILHPRVSEVSSLGVLTLDLPARAKLRHETSATRIASGSSTPSPVFQNDDALAVPTLSTWCSDGRHEHPRPRYVTLRGIVIGNVGVGVGGLLGEEA